MLVNGLDLGLDADIALAVALCADHADRGFMGQFEVGAEDAGDAVGLGTAAGVAVNSDRVVAGHGSSPIV